MGKTGDDFPRAGYRPLLLAETVRAVRVLDGHGAAM